MKKLKLNSGQSLFEVVLALGVVTIILVALVTLAALSIRNTTFSKNRNSATRYSQETVEWLRGQRDDDWTTFAVRAQTPTWCLPTLDWDTALIGRCGAGPGDFVLGTIFKREVSFTIIDATTIEAVIKVYWDDAQGTHETRTSTNFTNWRAR